jgi:hypothetical protein
VVSEGLRPAEEAQADQGARQVQEGQHRGGVAVVADRQPEDTPTQADYAQLLKMRRDLRGGKQDFEGSEVKLTKSEQ